MGTKKDVNVEKGKKGFQPRHGGKDAPVASAEQIARHLTLVEQDSNEPAYDDTYTRFHMALDASDEVETQLVLKRSELDEQEIALEAHESAAVEAKRQSDEAWQAYGAYREAQRPDIDRLTAEATAAIDEGRASARRLYLEAGVGERYADMFAQEISERAKRRREDRSTLQYPGNPEDYKPVKPMRFIGARRRYEEEVKEAAKHAKTDPGWKDANKKVSTALRQLKALYDDPQAHELHDRYSRASQKSREAETTLTQTRERVASLRDETADLASRKTNNVPLRTHDFPLRDLPGQHSSVARNPDGSTNAWAKITDTGTGAVRHVPIVGVSTERFGASKVNQFVTSEGHTLFASRQWSNTVHGSGESDTTPASVTIVTRDPDPGSAPLAWEGDPEAGFSGLLDTTG